MLEPPHDYFQWMTYVLNYIVNNDIKEIDDVEFHYLENKVCPGQTFTSIKTFVKSVNGSKLSNQGLDESEPLHETCYRRLNNTSSKILTNGSQKKVKLKIQRIEQIVNIYKLLIQSLK